MIMEVALKTRSELFIYSNRIKDMYVHLLQYCVLVAVCVEIFGGTGLLADLDLVWTHYIEADFSFIDIKQDSGSIG